MRLLGAVLAAMSILMVGCTQPTPAPVVPAASSLTATVITATATVVRTRPIAGYPPSADEDSVCAFTRRSLEGRHEQTYISTITPTAIQPGTNVSLKAQGLSPGVVAKAYLAKPGTEAQTDTLATTRVDATGSAEFTLRVPEDIKGSMLVRHFASGSTAKCLLLIAITDSDHYAAALLAYSEP